MEERALPNVLYHYTTQDGLLGILKESALWATKIHYMNDASELILPFQMASAILQELAKKEEEGKKRQVILNIRDDIKDWADVNICVASFCTDGDLLSQWRGYGLPGSAYTIGFDTERLLKNIQSQPFGLCPCDYYDHNDYRSKVNEFFLQILGGAIGEIEEGGSYVDDFIQMAARMKQPAAPLADASVGVAIPRMITPLTRKTINPIGSI